MIPKFRAFHKTERKMYPVDYISWEGGKIVEIGLESLTEDDNGYECYDAINSDNCDLMQSTDLTDANGKEIYEGDILRDMGNRVAFVVWFGGGFWIESPGSCARDNIFSKWVKDAECKIIGNIYENPEMVGGR